MQLKHCLAVLSLTAALSLLSQDATPVPELVIPEEKSSVTTTIKLGYESEFWDDGVRYAPDGKHDITSFTPEINFNWNGFNLGFKGYLPFDTYDYEKSFSKDWQSVLDARGDTGTWDGHVNLDDWKLQTCKINLDYTHIFQALPYVGNVSLLTGFRYTHYDNNLMEPYFEEDFRGERNDKYIFGCYSSKGHNTDIDSYKFSLGFSLDDVFLTPNALITFNRHGKFFAKFGMRHSLPLSFISERLTWNNTADIYFRGKNYYDVYSTNYSIEGITNNQEDIIYNEKTGSGKNAVEINRINKDNYDKIDSKKETYKGTNKAGFDNLIIQSSLNYELLNNVNLYVSLTASQPLNNIIENKGEFATLTYSYTTQYYWGAGISYTF